MRHASSSVWESGRRPWWSRLYIGEIAPARVRGGLVGLNQLALTSGILVSYLVDYWLASTENWRLMFGLAVIPAVVLLIGMMYQMESPHWLILQGREDEARAVLLRVRDADTGDEIEAEIHEVREVAERRAGARGLLSPAVRPLLAVGVLLAVAQQVTGINTVIYYAPTLLQGAGFGDSATLLANVVNGAVNVGMTLMAVWLLDRVGRRPLLLTGTAGMAIGMIITALSFLGGSRLTGGLAVVAVVGLLIYTGSFAVGLGPVFWLLIAEIYPLRVRGAAMSVATLANWGANFVVTISFLTLLSAIGGLGVFFLFGFLTLIALGYFWRRVPKTRAGACKNSNCTSSSRHMALAARGGRTNLPPRAESCVGAHYENTVRTARGLRCRRYAAQLRGRMRASQSVRVR
ncbi:sugar porter family MFS transporter [Streptomyces misionensis]|uniref:sugar porter family MFS transporter n=1 Tax=Streptomyces misionensis TaxID=67331 RepID=UPI0034102EA5